MKGLKLFESGMLAVYENKQQEGIVDGRELHSLLKVQTRFNDWISRKIRDYDFLAGQDFYSYLSKSKGGRKAMEYALKLDVAKEIAMVESNEIGRQIRKYFIEVEKRWRLEMERRASLQATKIEFPAFTAAIMDAHEEPKHYHFSNEINMIYRIVLGVDAKKFRELHGIDKGAVIKPYLTLPQIQAIEALQRADIGLILAIPDYEQRKQTLSEYYERLRRKRIA
ncbi:hypothetical protein JCM15765_08820 [Paradesulfitobacterium aromaticivorans]